MTGASPSQPTSEQPPERRGTYTLIKVTDLAALVKALEEIARQHKTDEMCEAEVDGADFENAYDIIIGRARAALAHRSAKT